MEQAGHGQDKRLVQKLLRYFVYRSIQVILQSRSGKLFRCACKAHSSPEVLGLSLEDDPDIAVSIKAKLGAQELRPNEAHSVQIFLSCDASERLYLEVWTFRFAEEADPAMRWMKTFDRLVVALKALWSASRVLPAYRVARRHTSERRVLCYCIEAGASDPAVLGPGYQNRRVASVRTSAGALSLTCSFRTPIPLGPEALQLHEGHYRLAGAADDPAADGVDTVDSAADAAADASSVSASPPVVVDEDAAVPSLPSPPPQQPLSPQRQPARAQPRCLAGPFAIVGNGGCDGNSGDADDDIDDLPFQTLMSDRRASLGDRCAELSADQSDDDVGNDETDGSDNDGADSGDNDTDVDDDNDYVRGGRRRRGAGDGEDAVEAAEAEASSSATAAADDDELLPFASDGASADLQRLARLKAPGVRLDMFAAPQPLADRIGDIARQLEYFESDLADFDLLLNGILERESDSETEEA